MIIQDIGGVFLYSPRPAELSAWYAEQFGLHFQSYTQEGDSEPQYYVELYARSDQRPTNRPSRIFAIRPTDYPLDPERRECMVNFEVDDLAGLAARLAATGIQVTNYHTEPFGSFAHLRDPDGNRIELFEPHG